MVVVGVVGSLSAKRVRVAGGAQDGGTSWGRVGDVIPSDYEPTSVWGGWAG